MASSHPIENLLRPPLEWWPGITYGLTGLLTGAYPTALMLTPLLGKLLSIGLCILGIQRIYQGYHVVYYQRNLKRLPAYTLSSKAIPISHKKLFLGKGFRWQDKHTQRLYEVRRSQSENHLKPTVGYTLARTLELRWEKKPVLKRLAKLLSSTNQYNPFRPLPLVGGNPAIHGVEPDEKTVWMNLAERVGHMLVLGTTRVGKTRFLEVQVTQDIHRGDVVIVFDPKGDGDLLRRIVFEAQQAGRAEEVLLFHLGFPDVSARYNPIGHFARITEVANRIANQLPSSGESAAFKEFAWRFVNIIARALVALGRKPNYQQIQRYILNIDPLLLDYCKLWLPKMNPHWEKDVKVIQQAIDERSLSLHLKTRSRYIIAIVNYIQRNAFYDAIAEGLCSAFSYDKTYFDKITASLLPLLEKLTTGKTAELISPDYFNLQDERPVFDWMQVIRGKKIVYVGLDALSDATVAGAVGSSMFSDLCSVAGQLYKFGVQSMGQENNTKTLYRISVHADEFNEMANDDVTTILNKGGGAGFQMTLYTQTWSDVEAKLGNAAKANQVGGNLNTLVCLRVLEEKTARFLTDKLAQRVPVYSLQPLSSVSDSPTMGTSADFNSTNEDRISVMEVPLLTPADLIQLPKGQAFCLIEGGQLWKIRMPLPQDNMQAVPATIDKMADAMKTQYQRHQQHIDTV